MPDIRLRVYIFEWILSIAFNEKLFFHKDHITG